MTATDKLSRRGLIGSGSLIAGCVAMSVPFVGVLAADSNQNSEAARMQAPAFTPATEYVFTITAKFDKPMVMGETAMGLRRAVPITGGSLEGKDIRGRIVAGGIDWQRVRSDGVTESIATYAVRFDDRTLVQVSNQGIVVPTEKGRGNGYSRTAISFVAPIGSFDWLNKSIFLCRSGLHHTVADTMLVEVFRLT